MTVSVTWQDVSDIDLVGALPDPDALEELFLRYRLMILAYGTRRCSRPEDVADLLAATFLAVLESASRYEARLGGVRPWLFGIARRQLGLLIRQEYRDTALRSRIAAVPEHHPDDMARIEEQIDASRAARDLEKALAALPEQHREALWLVGYDRLTPREAAQVIGVSPGAFRVRLSRARRGLRTSLSQPILTVPAGVGDESNPQEVHS